MNDRIVGLVVGVLVTGATYVLCANAHIDIFPCERVQRDNTYAGVSFAMLPCDHAVVS